MVSTIYIFFLFLFQILIVYCVTQRHAFENWENNSPSKMFQNEEQSATGSFDPHGELLRLNYVFGTLGLAMIHIRSSESGNVRSPSMTSKT